MTQYECLTCNFSSNLKSNYERHLKTNKHKNNVFGCEMEKRKKAKKSEKKRKKAKKSEKILLVQNVFFWVEKNSSVNIV